MRLVPFNRMPNARKRLGFTLPELVVSVAISGLIVASLGSALSIAARSVRPDASAATSLEVARSLRMLQDDLRFATRVIAQTSTSIRVLTTDADRNGSQDIVQYNWTGVSGTGLTRSVNGGTAVSICDNVIDFALTMNTGGEILVIPEPAVPNSEQLLDSCTSLSNTETVTVGWNDAYAQFVHPSMFSSPALTTNDEWQITRVDYYAARTEEEDGSYEFEIDRATDDGIPTNDELVSMDMDAWEVSDSGEWVSHTLTGLPWLAANDGVNIKLTYLWGLNRLQLWRTTPGSSDGYSTTDDSSTNWYRPATNRSLLFRVYGRTRSRLHADQAEPARRFSSVGIRLETSTLPGGPMHAAAELLNRPFDATVVANTDFATFSLTGDSNYDGQTDWTLSNISSSNSSTVASGKWTAANKTLRMNSTLPNGRIVDTHVVCRCNSTSGTVIIRAAAQQSTGGQSVSVFAYLTRTSAGTQTLSIYEETATDIFDLRRQFSMLDTSLQDIRLVLNPAEQTVSVWNNNVLLETFWLRLIAVPGVPARVQIQGWGSSSEFDLCSVMTRANSGLGGITP